MECSICGISDSKRPVFRAISPKGLIFICETCAAEEGFPMVREPRPEVEEPRKTVYERLSIMAGIKPKSPQERRIRPQTDEKSIKQIVNKNYEEKIKKQGPITHRNDLVDNFHWILMRIRRVKGLTQRQLADMINEPEEVVKMAEQGVVPEGYRILDKLENFFRVKLIKERFGFPRAQSVLITHPTHSPPIFQHQVFSQQTIQKETHPNIVELKKPEEKPIVQKKIHFDKETLNSLTIADLKRMKEERETREKIEKEGND